MSLDPLSPIAPARVRALLLPLGQIRGPRFSSFVERLQEERIVHLRDITADSRPNRTMFSPLAFPAGAIFYELITHMPPPSHLALYPFEVYREPLAIIAVADGKELGSEMIGKRNSINGRAPTLVEQNIRSLDQELEALRDTFGKALVHQVLVFDYENPEGHEIHIPEGITTIPPPEKCKRTTMKGVMCDISSLLLAEMTTFAKSIEGTSFIDSPGQMSGSRMSNGSYWSGSEDMGGHARRNSQFVSGTRSNSSTGLSEKADRSHVRMSMPPVPFKSSPSILHSTTSSRSSTPGKSALSNPPTTFDDLTGSQESGPSSPEQRHSRPGTAEGFRAPSQDRVSVQGFGSGGPNERWRLRGKARGVIVVGSMYLQAGRWTDALRELIEGATMARSVNDHVWHGKALELIVICLLLLAWAGIDFQVPVVCLPPQDKQPNDGGLKDIDNLDPSQPLHLRNLQVILPELLDRIVGLYSRISAENLPPLPLSEVIIRFCKLLSSLHIADGTVGAPFLSSVVLGDQPKALSSAPRLNIKPSRQVIANLAFRAFPSSASELLTTVDRVTILSGIASVLGLLSYHRKKGMVIRELISVLISGLVEARTRGAAEVGIHPAAGLVALAAADGHRKPAGSVALELQEGDIEQGIESFLGVLCKTYGIVNYEPGNGTAAKSDAATDGEAVARIRKQTAARFFGFPSVKLSVLRACINFSEALPDFNGVLKFSSELLRTAGSGVAPGPRREDAAPTIPREEQVRLVTNITKTQALSRRLGLDHLAAEYWDELLVRGVILDPLPASKVPVAHSKSVLPGVVTSRTSQDVDPFIYNPFLKQLDKAAVEQTLVAGEPATFRVTLQNPYDIDLDIESIKLEAEGAEFEPATDSTIIGPYRTQVLKITGTPRSSGALKITGAMVRVRGCRERHFSIFSQPWVPERTHKYKATGLAAFERNLALEGAAPPTLSPTDLSLKVIPEQPLVIVKSTTLPQSCAMILEGEKQSFSVTLKNTSSTTPVDFMLFSFEDSTQGPLQAALSNRDSTPTELYEYELILMKKQALKLKKKPQDKRYIAPGGEVTFEFEILGKPGLTNGIIQIDYAHLGMPADEVVDQFHTRRVSVQLTITVNASVEISRHDILPVLGEVPEPIWDRVNKSGGKDAKSSLSADRYCLLSLDLINAWPSTMMLRIEAEDDVSVEEYILPGNTSRVVFPVRRIFIEDPHASIPALNPKRNRQFVVSTSKTTPEFERGVREAFWYREKLLDSLRATWTTLTGPQRSGTVELRAIRLSSRMVDSLKIEDVGIDVFIEGPDDEEGPTEPASHHKSMFVDDFAQVRVRVSNRTTRPIYPLVRLMPALCHRPSNVALDYARKFAWNGTLQQVLPLLNAKSSTDVVLGVTVLCRGQFEITASVEETLLWRDAEEEAKKSEETGSRARSDTQTMLDAVLGKRERRIWHARKSCLITVRDRE
ncbi:hypothetical protein jhhlp_002432 [Lomentospora prolificans]|uniref:Hypercellular protein HypA n=1 Tax=Lomentospora prolificans TaxID=41688 RepID=A0A2N3NDX2_9PEZI|nr:hypothetical protein jhhlp_002432 [Lomentospora prolificans]